MVHGGRRRPLRRLRAHHRQHERPHPPVRRHRRALVHRPPDPRPDLHRGSRPDRHGVHGHRDQRRARLPARHHATPPTRPATRRHAHPRCPGATPQAQGVRPPRRHRERQRRRRPRQRRRRHRRRSTSSGVRVVGDPHTVSQATNRDYAVPTSMALTADRQGRPRSATPAPPPTALAASTPPRAAHAVRQRPGRHIVATERGHAPPRHAGLHLALGFGRTAAPPSRTAQGLAAARRSTRHRAGLRAGRWSRTTPALRQPHRPHAATQPSAYWRSANVSRPARTRRSRARSWPAWPAPGARRSAPAPCPAASRSTSAPTARCSRATSTRRSPGCWPRVTWRPPGPPRASCSSASSCRPATSRATRLLNGKAAPDTGGDQLDETAYPILMAYLTGLSGDQEPVDRPRQAGRRLPGRARPVVRQRALGGAVRLLAVDDRRRDRRPHRRRAHRPRAGRRARRPGLPGRRRRLPAHASRAGRSPRPARTAPTPYFIRLSKNGDPDSRVHLRPRQRQRRRRPARRRRRRLPGAGPPRRAAGRSTPTCSNSLKVLDQQHRARRRRPAPATTATARRPPGSEDGYGDCYTPGPDRLPAGRPAWPTTEHRLRPPVAGAVRRAGRGGPARPATRGRRAPSSASCSAPPPGVGLVPEQAWENPDLAASPYGSDPTTASIGFRDGHPAGSAAPLTWAQAQELRLLVDLSSRRIVDRPDRHHAPVRRPRAPPGARPRHRRPRPHRAPRSPDPRRSPGPPAQARPVDVSLVGNDTAGLATWPP